MEYDLIIAGAGAAGLMAGITAAEAGGRILLLEQKEMAGKKLLATGNGRCNFTNEILNADCYYGSRRLLSAGLDHFSREDLLAYFAETGLLPKNIRGYYYPNSRQASSVQTALSSRLSLSGARLMCGEKITDIKKDARGFSVKTEGTLYHGRKLLIACGLKAAPKLGSDGSLFSVLEAMGHRLKSPLPALCGFYAKGLPFKKLSGVRIDAGLTLLIDGKPGRSETGELQLTDYGISGIPVFQLSIPAVRALNAGKKVSISLNLLPGLFEDEDSLFRELKRRQARAPQAAMPMLLCGLLPEKMIPVLLSMAALSLTDFLSDLRENKCMKLIRLLRACEVTLSAPRDYEYAQVCCGGIPEDQVNPDLSSRLIDGLYFAGEILDVTGICGGYNLQWAFSSGHLAADSAMKDISVENTLT